MRQLLACLVFLLSFASSSTAAANPVSTARVATNKTLHPKIDNRIQALSLPVETTVSDRYLQRKLTDYLSGRHGTQQMLGRAERYFPIFEEVLCSYDLPEDLKYLSVVESMLIPTARSYRSAAGLWQLMPGTARSLGLRVDGMVDERFDPQISTDAAARMLQELYTRFGDWHLVVAAYNAGPSRVAKAVRYAGRGAAYARVKRYLPRETRNYVAAYVAAAYTLNYYAQHGLTPGDYKPKELGTVRIYRSQSLRRLARIADMPYRELRKLNPSLINGYVPRNQGGIEVVIPAAAKDAVQVALWGKPSLVLLHYSAEPADEVALAQVQGFVASEWMLGCKNLEAFNPGITFKAQVESWSKTWIDQQPIVAML